MNRDARDPIAIGLLLGSALDAAVGDQRRWHPVSGFGTAAGWFERKTYRPTRARGAAYVGALIGTVVAGGLFATRVARSFGISVPLATASTWTALGGRSLEREALAVHAHLCAHDLEAARAQIRNLVGRDAERLSEGELARACVESVAENCSDAVVAPLFWGAIAGVPGILGYRAVNTLDAMVGYRSPRYAEFGWAAARIDDAANWIPARLGAICAAALSPLVGGSPQRVISLVRRDAWQHPSPNAGQIETAFAAALNVQLGGENTYQGATENRGVLGDGSPVVTADIVRAVRLHRLVSLAMLGVALTSRYAVRSAMRRFR